MRHSQLHAHAPASVRYLSMTLAEHLRAMVATMPSGASVSLPVDWLRAQLEEEESSRDTTLAPSDLTLAEIAKRVHRAPSTVRGWLNGGMVPGAYRLRGRDWRVPPSALQAFLRQQAAPKAEPVPRRRDRAPDLGSWRQLNRKAGTG